MSPSQSVSGGVGGLYHILQQMGYQLTGAHAPGGNTYPAALHQLLYQHGAGIGINGAGAVEMYEEGDSEGDDSEYDFEEEDDWDVQGEDTGSGSEGFSDDMSEDEGEIEAEGVADMELQGSDRLSVVMESEQEQEDEEEVELLLYIIIVEYSYYYYGKYLYYYYCCIIHRLIMGLESLVIIATVTVISIVIVAVPSIVTAILVKSSYIFGQSVVIVYMYFYSFS